MSNFDESKINRQRDGKFGFKSAGSPAASLSTSVPCSQIGRGDIISVDGQNNEVCSVWVGKDSTTATFADGSTTRLSSDVNVVGQSESPSNRLEFYKKMNLRVYTQAHQYFSKNEGPISLAQACEKIGARTPKDAYRVLSQMVQDGVLSCPDPAFHDYVHGTKKVNYNKPFVFRTKV
ncbi:hypothetical protein [Actinomyces vulturis]|uniref:hypothetical protein n=1 Tax=Actinomyces vulturis TaxID=1857645 RepID=UPI00082D18CB|nr:hypothetical protein [Actinomyces vulturis]